MYTGPPTTATSVCSHSSGSSKQATHAARRQTSLRSRSPPPLPLPLPLPLPPLRCSATAHVPVDARRSCDMRAECKHPREAATPEAGGDPEPALVWRCLSPECRRGCVRRALLLTLKFLRAAGVRPKACRQALARLRSTLGHPPGGRCVPPPELDASTTCGPRAPRRRRPRRNRPALSPRPRVCAARARVCRGAFSAAAFKQALTQLMQCDEWRSPQTRVRTVRHRTTTAVREERLASPCARPRERRLSSRGCERRTRAWRATCRRAR